MNKSCSRSRSHNLILSTPRLPHCSLTSKSRIRLGALPFVHGVRLFVSKALPTRPHVGSQVTDSGIQRLLAGVLLFTRICCTRVFLIFLCVCDFVCSVCHPDTLPGDGEHSGLFRIDVEFPTMSFILLSAIICKAPGR